MTPGVHCSRRITAAWVVVLTSLLGASPAQADRPPPQLGFNESFSGQHAGVAEYAASVGASFARFGAYQESFEWSDAQARAAQAAGLRPMIALVPNSPDPANCAAFAVAVAERYPDALLEGWNEPNHSMYGALNPREAGHCYLAAAQAVAPRRILAPGLAPNAESRWYLKQMLKVAGRRAPLAIHPYPNSRVPEAYMQEVRDQISWAQEYRGRRRLYVTEIGVSSGPGFVSEVEQADYLTRMVALLIRKEVRSIIVHRVIDVPAHTEWESGLGILRLDLSQKPAFTELQQVVERRLGDQTVSGTVSCPVSDAGSRETVTCPG